MFLDFERQYGKHFKELERMFDTKIDRRMQSESLSNEIVSDDTGSVIKLSIPGVDPATVTAEVNDLKLIIGYNDGKLVTRTYHLSSQLDTDAILVEYQFGILTVTIPTKKQTARKTHQIPVTIK